MNEFRLQPQVPLEGLESDFIMLFSPALADQWPTVRKATKVIYLMDLALLPADVIPFYGMSAATWVDILNFCQQYQIKISIISTFGRYLYSLPEGEKSDRLLYRADLEWEQNPTSSFKTMWTNLSNYCAMADVDKDIVHSVFYDSVIQYLVYDGIHNHSSRVMNHICQQSATFFGYIKAMFPAIKLSMGEAIVPDITDLVDYGSDLRSHQILDRYDRAFEMVNRWVRAYKDTNGHFPDEVEFDRNMRPNIWHSSYDSPFDRPYFVHCRRMTKALQELGIKVGFLIQDSSESVHSRGFESASDQIACNDMFSFARCLLVHYNCQPDFVQVSPYSGRPRLNFPEIMSGASNSVLSVARDIVHLLPLVPPKA
jgi:hypothetical protein